VENEKGMPKEQNYIAVQKYGNTKREAMPDFGK